MRAPTTPAGAPDAWRQGPLSELDIIDDAAFLDVPGLPWRALREVLDDASFSWPATSPSPAMSDAIRQANLLRWHPADAHEVLNSDAVGADELCHMAVHRALYRALGRPQGWRGWLLCEACASATDMLVLGALLRARRDAEFVALQVEVLSECWRDAERDEGAFEAALMSLAADPVAVFRALVQLLEDHVGDLLSEPSARAAHPVQAAADAFARRLASPWGPLLLHFQTAWWASALGQLPDPEHERAAADRARAALLESDAPLTTLLALPPVGQARDATADAAG